MQEALRGALEVPFETMQLALAVASLARGAAAINPTSPAMRHGALACLAGLEGAFRHVKINALSIKDADFRARQAATRPRACGAKARAGQAVRATVTKHLGG
jgi:formiminotetrahydrofolate cyclodeaminase